MKTTIAIVCFIAMIRLLPAQVNSSEHNDSIWYEGRYYSKVEYPKAKEKYDQLNFETWLMPGIAYAYYNPVAKDSTGSFKGIAVEYLIYGEVHQNDDPGPSHVRLYSKLNIMKSDKKDVHSLFMYTMGIDLSLEKNPKRTYMIPYFGIEFGGMSQKELGSTPQFTPTFGLHILSKKNLFINFQGGYVYPLKNFETYQGWIGQVGVNFAMW